jgi:hypothetical protein
MNTKACKSDQFMDQKLNPFSPWECPFGIMTKFAGSDLATVGKAVTMVVDPS